MCWSSDEMLNNSSAVRGLTSLVNYPRGHTKMIRLVVSTRLKVAIDRHSHYVIIFHSECFTEQQLVGFRSREGQAVANPSHPAGICRERAPSRRKESTSVSVSQVNPIVRIVWYRENGIYRCLFGGISGGSRLTG
jgi:hypothetical protein